MLLIKGTLYLSNCSIFFFFMYHLYISGNRIVKQNNFNEKNIYIISWKDHVKNFKEFLKHLNVFTQFLFFITGLSFVTSGIDFSVSLLVYEKNNKTFLSMQN